MAPGTLVYTGNRQSAPSNVHTFWYDDHTFSEKPGFAPEICPLHQGTTWVDIRSLTDAGPIEQTGAYFGIHPLALEDVLDTTQRAKLDEYENGLFFVLPNLKFDPTVMELQSEQISFFLGKNYVIAFQEDPDDTLHAVRKRLQEGLGRLRKKGADYLTYSLIDAVVDNYYMVLDEIEAQLLELEQGLYQHGDAPQSKALIFNMKRVVNDFRHRMLPLREAVTRFYRTESELVEDANRLYFRDVLDHVAQILDSIDNQRDILANIEALFQAEASNRLNNVMRLLTVISTIFIPLSFVAGVYGMNFDNMPELHTKHGYFIVLGIMFLLMIGMLGYFRTKKWI
ncbi:MAG: magnesium/cobalt transporter CorA [Bacteroidota bacterium]